MSERDLLQLLESHATEADEYGGLRFNSSALNALVAALGDAEPAAVLVLGRILEVTRRYCPPGGPVASEAMAEIIALIDPWPLTIDPPAGAPGATDAERAAWLAEPVKAWVNAYREYLEAVNAYNTRLAAIREREQQFPEDFGRDNPQAEWQAWHEAERKARALVMPMYEALAAHPKPAAPATAPRFSCHLERDLGQPPCSADCGKLRCMYPSDPPPAWMLERASQIAADHAGTLQRAALEIKIIEAMQEAGREVALHFAAGGSMTFPIPKP